MFHRETRPHWLSEARQLLFDFSALVSDWVITPDMTPLFQQMIVSLKNDQLDTEHLPDHIFHSIIEYAAQDEPAARELLMLIALKNKDIRKKIPDESLAMVAGDITCIQKQARRFKENPIDVIIRKIIPINIGKVTYHTHISYDLKNQLRTAFANAAIHPIIKITALAMCGYSNVGSLKITDGHHADGKLRIKIDLDGSAIDNMMRPVSEDDVDSSNCAGAYRHDLHEIELGGKDIWHRHHAQVFETLIHEMTHFVVTEVFMNKANPYNTESDEIDFNKICTELYSRRHHTHPTLQFFDAYEQSQWHAELIARSAQIIALEGMSVLAQHSIGLARFHMNVFIPACKQHLDKLEHDYCYSSTVMNIKGRNF